MHYSRTAATGITCAKVTPGTGNINAGLCSRIASCMERVASSHASTIRAYTASVRASASHVRAGIIYAFFMRSPARRSRAATAIGYPATRDGGTNTRDTTVMRTRLARRTRSRYTGVAVFNISASTSGFALHLRGTSAYKRGRRINGESAGISGTI